MVDILYSWGRSVRTRTTARVARTTAIGCQFPILVGQALICRGLCLTGRCQDRCKSRLQCPEVLHASGVQCCPPSAQARASSVSKQVLRWTLKAMDDSRSRLWPRLQARLGERHGMLPHVIGAKMSATQAANEAAVGRCARRHLGSSASTQMGYGSDHRLGHAKWISRSHK